MIALYILLPTVIILIIWLVLRKKWKALLWTVIGLIVIAIAGWFFLLHIVSEAFGEKCENNRVWKIENHVLVEKKCIGFAGPHYYPVYLYKDNKEIDHSFFVNDSTCMIKFKPDVGDTLTFNICEMKLEGKKN